MEGPTSRSASDIACWSVDYEPKVIGWMVSVEKRRGAGTTWDSRFEIYNLSAAESSEAGLLRTQSSVAEWPMWSWIAFPWSRGKSHSCAQTRSPDAE